MIMINKKRTCQVNDELMKKKFIPNAMRKKKTKRKNSWKKKI